MLNVTWLKFGFVFAKSVDTMPMSYVPAFVSVTVHDAVGVADTEVVTSYRVLSEVMLS